METQLTKNKSTNKITFQPDDVEQGLAQLVLTVLELLRQLMERQAVRRVNRGNLNDEQIEILGRTLLRLEEKILEYKVIFGIEDLELNIDLGPLGKLL